MGYNARNDEIRDNVTRMRREWEAQRDALATVRRFNARLSAKGYSWFWPKIAAALTQNITGSLSIATVAALGLLLCENLPLIMDAAVLFKLSALCDFH
jgi:hypothetical protein